VRILQAIHYLLQRRAAPMLLMAMPHIMHETVAMARLRPEVPARIAGLPVHGVVTSPFGRRMHPLLHRMRMHAGEDIAAPLGAPVWATAAGRVASAGTRHGYGRTVVIDHGGGLQTTYAHLQSISVRAGETVSNGTVIGTCGQSGLATGPHVHYEVRRDGVAVNPEIG
jgi:murein DD-endopeptidase MepM/ murein hydrolase activator NlpD